MQVRTLRTIVAGRPALVVTRSSTVTEAARQMKQRNVGSALVVDGTRLVGIFTERDALYRVLAAGRDPASTGIGDVMTPQPQTMHPDEPFVRVLSASEGLPATGHVAHSNRCHMAVVELPEQDLALVVAVIDNLVKGASGQAIQNWNALSGFPETTGLA